MSGTLKHAIDRDEKNVQVALARVWTGSGPDGKYSTNDCDKWTPTGNNGRAGESDKTNAAWTSAAVDDCNSLHRLYCFEN